MAMTGCSEPARGRGVALKSLVRSKLWPSAFSRTGQGPAAPRSPKAILDKAEGQSKLAAKGLRRGVAEPGGKILLLHTTRGLPTTLIRPYRFL
jgi:hypothetical protein